ncbi:MAG: hypothetical protein QXF57_03845, partial [Acidilobaceae archaeon]
MLRSRDSSSLKQWAEKRQGVGFIDVYDYLSLALFGRVVDWFTKTFEMEDALRRAGWSMYPQLYSARVLMATFLSLFISLYVVLVVWWFAIDLILRVILSLFS